MDKQYQFFQNLIKEIPEIPGDSIISRTLYADEHLKVVLLQILMVMDVLKL